MADTKLSQKEEAIAFAKEHGFTIGLETIDRRTYYHAVRGEARVESQGYGNLTVRMRKHLESLGELAPKVFQKTQSRAAGEAAHVSDQPKIMPVALNWKTPDAAEACKAKTITDFKIPTRVQKGDTKQLETFIEAISGKPMTDTQKSILKMVSETALPMTVSVLDNPSAHEQGIQAHKDAEKYLRGSNSAPVVMIFDDLQFQAEDTPELRKKFSEYQWEHKSDPMPRRAHYRRPSKPSRGSTEWVSRRPWVVYANGNTEYVHRFATRDEAVTCVRRFLSDNALIKASVGAMEIKFERG